MLEIVVTPGHVTRMLVKYLKSHISKSNWPEYHESVVTGNDKGEITSLHYYTSEEYDVPTYELNILGDTGEIVDLIGDVWFTFKIN